MRTPTSNSGIKRTLPLGGQVSQTHPEWSTKPLVGRCHQRVDLYLAHVNGNRADGLGTVNEQKGAHCLGGGRDSPEVIALTSGIFHVTNRNDRSAFINRLDKSVFVNDTVFRCDIMHLRTGMARNARPRICGAREYN